MHTLLDHTKRLLDLLPNGKLMKDKYDPETNIYKFWQAIAMYYVILEEDIEQLTRELSISTTEDLIARWEKEFGIPDEVFGIAATLEERRQNVLLKKGGLNLLNIEDFRNLAISLGYTDIVIQTSSEIRFPPYDVPFYPLSEPAAYYICVIRGDFSITNISFFADFLEQLLPINVGLLLIDTSV